MSILESTFVQSVLNIPFISRIRRNHGLEHATLHMLSTRRSGQVMGGHSDHKGFWVMGNVSIQEVQEAVKEALHRLRAGEEDLAVHPNCGTNFVTAGTIAGVVAFAGMWGAGPRKRDKLERLPLVATLATLGLIMAQPFGLALQKHVTTSGLPGGMEVVEIVPSRRGHVQAYRVVTRG